MSFVEKHKAWLLPLLALGVGGVVYLNLQTFSDQPAPPAQPPSSAEGPGATPGTEPASAPAPPTPAAPAIPPPSAPPPSAPPPLTSAASGDGGSDLWADLRPYAVVPHPLDQDAELQILARSSQEAETTAPSRAVPHPGSIREPQPRATGGPGVEGPAPDVDFLVTTPSGARAWFGGQGYRTGQTLEGRPYVVGPIAPSHVDLKGPGGRTRRWTNPMHAPAPSPETP